MILKMKQKPKKKVVSPKLKPNRNKKFKPSPDIMNKSKSFKNLKSRLETSIKEKKLEWKKGLDNKLENIKPVQS